VVMSVGFETSSMIMKLESVVLVNMQPPSGETPSIVHGL